MSGRMPGASVLHADVSVFPRHVHARGMRPGVGILTPPHIGLSRFLLVKLTMNFLVHGHEA